MKPMARSDKKRESVTRRRWLIGAEPFLEGGWLHKGGRAKNWDVESELIAFALIGDVTVDLANTRSMPAEVNLKAYAIGRDVDVFVSPGTHVELMGWPDNDHLLDEAPSVPEEQRTCILRIEGHTLFGDVVVRVDPNLLRT